MATGYAELTRLVGRFGEVRRRWGMKGVLRRGGAKVIVFASYPVQRTRLGRRRFVFDGHLLPYFIHHYNATWRAERLIEIPIAQHFLRHHAGRGLEVGNVLPHYLPTTHAVVDKYERAAGVLNLDVLDYRPPAPLDWIVTISTLEHVGWDETPREPEKLSRAVQHLRGLLAPTGVMLATCPRGFNSHLDHAIEDGSLHPTREFFLTRRGTANAWREESREQALAQPPEYDRGATDLWVAEFSAVLHMGSSADGDAAQCGD